MANKNIQLKNRNGDLLFPRTRVGLLVNDSGVAVDVALQSDLPEKVSDLVNDAGYITVDVSTLANYYLKSETYTQTEVNNLIAAVKQFAYEIVTSDPEKWDQEEAAKHLNKIILYKPSGKSYYIEYVVINTGSEADPVYKVEKLGDTDIKLENYYTKSEIDGKVSELNTAIAGKVAQSAYDTKIADIESDIADKVDQDEYDGKISELETAIDGKVDKVTGKGLSTEDYTTAEKTKLGGIEAGAEVNVIEIIKLNGHDLSVDSAKRVDLGTIATSEELTTLAGRVSALETKVGNDTVANQIDSKIAALNLANTYYGKSAGEANATAITGLQGRMTTAENAIDALELLVGDTSVSSQIDAKITALNLPNTYYSKTAGEANAAAIAGIKNGTTINNFGGVESALADIESEIEALPFVTYEEIA